MGEGSKRAPLEVRTRLVYFQKILGEQELFADCRTTARGPSFAQTVAAVCSELEGLAQKDDATKLIEDLAEQCKTIIKQTLSSGLAFTEAREDVELTGGVLEEIGW